MENFLNQQWINETISVENRAICFPVKHYTKEVLDTGIVIAHGLGSRNPKTKGYSTDPWVQLIADGSQRMSQGFMYTAVGHKDTDGWQLEAEANPNYFTWDRLSYDMNDLAKHFEYKTYIASGNSMGSATALYAAINFPDVVKGVIMVRPPTAWETRRARRQNLLNSAKRCEEEYNAAHENYHLVLKGAALADLPSLDNTDLWTRIKCPVLMLTIEGDEAHPVSTALALKDLFANLNIDYELHIASDAGSAKSSWPAVIEAFLKKIRVPLVSLPVTPQSTPLSSSS